VSGDLSHACSSCMREIRRGIRTFLVAVPLQ
jgi:hypothetical protein